MSTRHTAACFLLFTIYVGLLAWPVAWLFRASGWGGPGVILGVLILSAGVVAPVLALRRAFRGRGSRFAARVRDNEGLASWGGIGVSLGGVLSIVGPQWWQAACAGLAAVGTGVILWGAIRSLPVGEPPDVTGGAPL